MSLPRTVLPIVTSSVMPGFCGRQLLELVLQAARRTVGPEHGVAVCRHIGRRRRDRRQDTHQQAHSDDRRNPLHHNPLSPGHVVLRLQGPCSHPAPGADHPPAPVSRGWRRSGQGEIVACGGRDRRLEARRRTATRQSHRRRGPPRRGAPAPRRGHRHAGPRAGRRRGRRRPGSHRCPTRSRTAWPRRPARRRTPRAMTAPTHPAAGASSRTGRRRPSRRPRAGRRRRSRCRRIRRRTRPACGSLPRSSGASRLGGTSTWAGSRAITSRYVGGPRDSNALWVPAPGCTPPNTGATPVSASTARHPTSREGAARTRWSIQLPTLCNVPTDFCVGTYDDPRRMC